MTTSTMTVNAMTINDGSSIHLLKIALLKNSICHAKILWLWAKIVATISGKKDRHFNLTKNFLPLTRKNISNVKISLYIIKKFM